MPGLNSTSCYLAGNDITPPTPLVFAQQFFPTSPGRFDYLDDAQVYFQASKHVARPKQHPNFAASSGTPGG